MRRVGVFALLVFAAGCGKNPRQYVDAGNRFLQAHKYDEASINFRNAIQKDPNLADGYYGLGQVFVQQGKAAQAYASLSRAVDLAPQNWEAKRQLANLALGGYLGDRRRPKNLYDELNKLAGQFLAHDANSYDGLRLRGYIELNDNQREQALRDFQKALQVKPSDPEITVTLAQIFFQETKTAGEGEKLLRDLIANRKDAGTAYDVLYRYYESSKRPAEAENILKSKVAANPKQAGYLLELAEHYRRAGKTVEMTSTLAVLLNDPNTFPKGRLLAGDFYNQAGNREQALKYYEEGAQTATADKLFYQKRAIATLTTLGRSDAALGVIDQALTGNSRDAELHMARAMILVNQEKIDPALAELQQQDQQQKDNPLVKYQLGRALMLKGKTKEAVATWQESARLRPSYIEPRLGLASYALDTRRFDEAQRWTDQVLAVAPGNLAGQLLRANVLQGLGRREEAKTLLTGLHDKLPGNAAVDLEYAFLELRESKPAEAEKLFRAHYTPGQQSPRPLSGLVEALFVQKHGDEAIRVLQADLAKAPGRAPVQMMLANAFLAAGQTDSGLQTLEQITAAHPDDLQARLRLGQIQTLKGNVDAAAANFAKARELAPQSTEPLLSLAQLEERRGQTDAAQKDYEAVLKLDPANLVALNNLAYLTADSGGNLEEALRLITTASQRLPKQPNLADTLGYVYLKQKRVSSALQVFGDLAQHYPANATFRFHHALALIESGSKEQARKELEAALADKPSADLTSKIKQAMDRIGGISGAAIRGD
jgi:tetratricopeptide (TPR) repeat protein